MKALVAGRVSNIAVVLFTDIVKSVDLRTSLGEDEFGKLKDQHDKLFESLLTTIVPQGDGGFLKSTGDGFLKLFQTAADAVRFALLFQHALLTAPWNRGQLKVRVGINIGDVTFVQQPSGRDVSGIAVDIAARVMSLAIGGQILMTPAAFNSARHNVKESGLGQLQKLRWIEHGAYEFQGWDKPMEIFEIGVEGVSPLKPPPASDKAAPLDSDKQKKVIGWRPAEGQNVDGKPEWILERAIGAGGFGEAWLATHRALGTHTVFKFCFDNRTLESLQRETHIFRTLRKELGERNDIAKLIDVRLEGEPPYYLQSDYAEGGDLRNWADKQGGIGRAPMRQRIDIVAQVAAALAAAHSVGILHKDIKPANILMDEVRGPNTSAAGVVVQAVQPKLSDFGIGEILVSDDSAPPTPRSMPTGSRSPAGYTTTTGISPYIAPEVAVGGLPTTASDVYSIGVLLYQCAVGDLSAPFGGGWERDVDDVLLRGDIAACTDKDPSKRIGAAKLAENLETLAARHRRRKQRKQMRQAAFAAVSLLLCGAIGAAVVGIRGYMHQKALAERNLITADEVRSFMIKLLQSTDPQQSTDDSGDAVTVVTLLDEGHRQLIKQRELQSQPDALADVCLTLGNAYLQHKRPDSARELFDLAANSLKDARPPLPEKSQRLQLAAAEAAVERGSPESIESAGRIVESLKDATLSAGDSAVLSIVRARLASAVGDWKKAADEYSLAEKYFAQDSSSPAWKKSKAQLLRATALFNAGDNSAADDQLRKIEEPLKLGGKAQSPLMWECRGLRARMYMKVQQYGEARQLLTELYAHSQKLDGGGAASLNTAYAADSLAEAEEAAGDFTAAAQHRAVGVQVAKRAALPPELKAYFFARHGLTMMQVDKGAARESLELAMAELNRIPRRSQEDEAMKKRVETALHAAQLPGSDRPGS